MDNAVFFANQHDEDEAITLQESGDWVTKFEVENGVWFLTVGTEMHE